ncbi:hypothetical protein [Ramlibacter sp.]|uniref:hypothetical protein n=1 Tax=Ramlibacter sp. TaxID=1917967 RepID=UPI0035AFD50F
MTLKTTLMLPSRKPRNPLAVAVRFRRAGVHQTSRSAQRQQAREAVRRELGQLHSP